MALSPHFISLGELYEKDVEGVDDDEVLIRLKRLAAEFLPDGWKDWRVDISVRESEVDPQLINKVRFALPTVGMALAFDPKASRLGEKSYRDMKMKMIGWDFCRGLIYSPPHFAVQVRGSQVHHQLVVQSIRSVKEQFLSRKDASSELAGGEEEISSQRSFSGGSTSHNPGSRSLELRIGALEKNFENSQSLLERILRQVSGDRPEEEEEDDGSGEEEEENEDGNDTFAYPEEMEGESVSSWKAPSLEPDKNFETNAFSFDFLPATKEQEPAIPEPVPEIKRQGIECQRFGKQSWDKIRYNEVQKKLQASPVFSQLQINSGLPINKGAYTDILAKIDSSFGTICHSLLKQRAIFQKSMRDFMSKHPQTAEDLKAMFGGTQAEFRVLSDDLLQYVCGKRAEIIELRRRNHMVKDQTIIPLLQKIPPSDTHLFEEEKLETVRRDHGFRKPFLKRTYPSNFINSDQIKQRKIPRLSRSFTNNNNVSKNNQSNRRGQARDRNTERSSRKDEGFRGSNKKLLNSRKGASRF